MAPVAPRKRKWFQAGGFNKGLRKKVASTVAKQMSPMNPSSSFYSKPVSVFKKQIHPYGGRNNLTKRSVLFGHNFSNFKKIPQKVVTSALKTQN